MRGRTMMLAAATVLALAAGPVSAAGPTLEQLLGYRYVSGLVAAEHQDRIAWVEDVGGVRNVWTASGPAFAPHPLTRYTADNGQEITQLHVDEAGGRVIYVLGGDHDANWPAEGDLAPDPDSATTQPKVRVWAAPLAGGAPAMLAEGDQPAVSVTGRVAWVKDGQVWALATDGKPARLFFDRGKDRALAWSPDGRRLAFVSGRGDHSFVGVFTDGTPALTWLAPSTGRDDDLAWSPDGTRIAFTRRPGDGGAPEPMLTRIPHPWAIWTADATTGAGMIAWQGPVTLDGSYPEAGDGVGLRWMAGGRLTFLATLDGWEHLYALPAAGGAAKLLTPGHFMVEHVAPAHDKASLFYAANTGATAGDDDRRHAFRVALDGSAPVALTSGTGLEWTPVPAGRGVALVSADATHPAAVALAEGRALKPVSVTLAYPSDALVTPKLVSFTAPDGLVVQGQLFARPGAAAGRHPAVVFVHGGPSRQMLLGWHYMDYYSNGYAVNQYLASRGFVVLSVNYRLGIGYGRAFEQPDHWGPTGGAEYQDVLAGARFLQALPTVDPARIGIWGGSYGGYLTGMALSRNSDVFKAGSDLHGVHDWSRLLYEEQPPAKRYEQGDWADAMKVAFDSSPDAQVSRWRSPVLLIQGDDDRNVRFNQTVDLARRLTLAGVPHEELVLPDEIHGFLRRASWLKADMATVRFLEAKLMP